MSSSPTSLDVLNTLSSLDITDVPPARLGLKASDTGTVISNDRRPDRDSVLKAAESRHSNRPTLKTTRISTAHEYEDFDGNHKLRTEFRRMINPGIMRNNPREVGLEALRLLTKIAEDMLKHTGGGGDYPKVKPTGNKMKKFVMEANGTVEVLRALGFGIKVVEMEQLYCFNGKYLETLRVGTHCLKEALNTEFNREETAEREKRRRAANEKAAKTKVVNAFYDDRRRVKYAERGQSAAESRRDRGVEVDHVPGTSISSPSSCI